MIQKEKACHVVLSSLCRKLNFYILDWYMRLSLVKCVLTLLFRKQMEKLRVLKNRSYVL